MDSDSVPIFETSYFGSHIKIFPNRIEWKILGTEKIILINQITSVNVQWGYNQIILDTTGGKKIKLPTNKKEEVKKFIIQAKNKPEKHSYHTNEAKLPPVENKAETIPLVRNSGKPWYKKWWGILLLVLFWPITVLWWAWHKPNLNHLVKIGITVGVIVSILAVAIMKKQAKDFSLQNNVNLSIPPTATSTPVSTTQAYIFDVPSLIGKNIDEINIELAQYKDKTLEPNQQQINQGVREWEAQYTKDGKELLVTYDIKTKKVVDFFISTDDPSGATTGKERLLELGNLSQDNPTYRIEFVKAFKYPDRFTGIKIIPK